jgi:hypothetical protein
MNMKNTALAAAAFFAATFALAGNCQKPTDVAAQLPLQPLCTSPKQPVREDRFIAIGDSEQWVTIRGDSCANPVILFLHGGPGNTLSPYAARGQATSHWCSGISQAQGARLDATPSQAIRR